MSKRLFLLVALLLAAFPLSAQETMDLPVTITSDNGDLSFSLPEGWDGDTQSRQTATGTTLVIGFAVSQPSAVSKLSMTEGTVLAPGEVIFGVTAGPIAPVYNASSNATAIELLRAAISGPIDLFGGVTGMTLGGYPAARAERSHGENHEVNYVIDFGNGNYALIVAYTPEAEFMAWEPTLLAIADTVRYEGFALPQSATVANGLLTFRYPSQWLAQAAPAGRGGEPTVIIGGMVSSQAVAQKMASGPDVVLRPGEIAVQFLIGDLTQRFDIDSSASARQLASAVAVSNDYSNVQIAEATVGDRPAVLLRRESGGFDSLDVAVAYGDGNFLVLTLFTAPDLSTDSLPLALALAQAMQYGDSTAADSGSMADALAGSSESPATFSVPLSETAALAAGAFQVNYPPGWQTRPAGRNGVVLANNDAGLAPSFGDPMPAGSVQVLLSLAPGDELLPRLGLGENAPVTSVLEAITRLSPAIDSMTLENTAAGRINDQPAARLIVRGNGFDAMAFLAEYPGRNYVAIQIITAPGELPDFQDIALAIADSIQYQP